MCRKSGRIQILQGGTDGVASSLSSCLHEGCAVVLFSNIMSFTGHGTTIKQCHHRTSTKSIQRCNGGLVVTHNDTTASLIIKIREDNGNKIGQWNAMWHPPNFMMPKFTIGPSSSTSEHHERPRGSRRRSTYNQMKPSTPNTHGWMQTAQRNPV